MRVAQALGISGHQLKRAMCGAMPFPIEYVAAIAAYFPEQRIIPTSDELNDILTDKRAVPTGGIRGRAYISPDEKPLPPGVQPFLTWDDAKTWPHDDWDPALAAEASELERTVEEHVSTSAVMLVTSFLLADLEAVETAVRIRIAPGPVPTNRKIRLETYPGTERIPFQVEVEGEVDGDWAETVLANGVELLDYHFVTRVIDVGDDPTQPRTVEALFVTPDLDTRECMPMGRPYVASVEWRPDDERREVIPILTPVLDGYAAELLGQVLEAGDPHGIEGLFPGQAKAYDWFGRLLDP